MQTIAADGDGVSSVSRRPKCVISIVLFTFKLRGAPDWLCTHDAHSDLEHTRLLVE